MTVSQHDARVRRRRVVIADDESIIRLDLGEMLANLGYEVVGEGSDKPLDAAENVVAFARNRRVEIIFSWKEAP